MIQFTSEDKSRIVCDAVAVLIGEDYEIIQKKAALLLLKAFLPHDIVNNILANEVAYPFDRNDPRVRAWTKEIVMRGKCEECGATERLEAHHIIKWSEYPKGRIDPKNGECLCHRCHTKAHLGDTEYYMMAAKYKD